MKAVTYRPAILSFGKLCYFSVDVKDTEEGSTTAGAYFEAKIVRNVQVLKILIKSLQTHFFFTVYIYFLKTEKPIVFNRGLHG